MDDAVVQDTVATYLMNCLSEFNLFKIGVHCDLEELKRREVQRGDRTIGEAEWQFQHVHHHLKYDLELDTTTETPEFLANKIIDLLVASK